MVKKLLIEFIRPVTINGYTGRYHNFDDIESVIFTEQILDLRTSKFAYKCPLGIVRYFQLETNLQRII